MDVWYVPRYWYFELNSPPPGLITRRASIQSHGEYVCRKIGDLKCCVPRYRYIVVALVQMALSNLLQVAPSQTTVFQVAAECYSVRIPHHAQTEMYYLINYIHSRWDMKNYIQHYNEISAANRIAIQFGNYSIDHIIIFGSTYFLFISDIKSSMLCCVLESKCI